jgi:methanol metabolism-related c-type cytochrome
MAALPSIQAARTQPVRSQRVRVALAAATLLVTASTAHADGSGDPKAVRSEDGKYYDKNGNPTYNIEPDGKVDWFTYSGFRRYHSECHVCHGPNGDGSSFAPALKTSLVTMNYSDFANIVVNGRKNVTTSQENVMPSFGNNANVMCYLDDIYVYLRARSNGAIPDGRPASHEDKSKATDAAESSCMGMK